MLVKHESYFVTEPKLLKDINTDEFRAKYKTAICRCNVSLAYGLIIPREYTHFVCRKCGTGGEIR